MARKHRANGEGTLEKRGKYYLARWRFQGKNYSKSTKCTDKREAEKVLAELVKPFQLGNEIDALSFVKAKLESQTKPDETKNPPTKISLIFTKYSSDISLSTIKDATYKSYTYKLAALERYAKEHDIEYAHQFTKRHAEELLLQLKQRNKPSSYNAYLKIYKMIFKGLMKNDNNVKVNPFETYNFLREDKSNRRREFTDEELIRLHEVLANEELETQLFFMFGEYCGMRISDAASVKWCDIDFKSRMIRYLPIKTSKNGIKAIVPIHDDLNKLLMTQLKLKKDLEYVIPSIRERYQGNGIFKFCNDIFAKADIKVSSRDANTGKNQVETGFHSLRRTFASRCSRDGIPIIDIQTMLGHSSPMMSIEYVRTKERNLFLPEFNVAMTQVKIKTATYEKIMKLINDNETFDDFLDRILNHKSVNLAKIWFDNEERKRKEAEEIDKMIDEVFGDKFNIENQYIIISYHIRYQVDSEWNQPLFFI